MTISRPAETVYSVNGKKVRIVLGRGVLDAPDWPKRLVRKADRACVVADSSLPPRHIRKIRRALAKSFQRCHVYSTPGGESAKSLESYGGLQAFLIDRRLTRRSVLVAVGGGSISDLTGFAAATYMRGIRWVCLPTTLLAQVDAGLGGKVGINLTGAKNMVGAFWQPAAVVCDTACLPSLDARQRISGLGEMVKCALLFDRGLFEALRRDWRRISDLEEPALSRAMRACIRYKMRVVSKDERDIDGPREFLNLGHTFAHALESISAPGLSHGEAVIWGLRAAVFLSRELGLMKAEVCASIQEFLGVLPAGGFRHQTAPEDFLRRLSHDKKRAYGGNRLVLLRSPARPIVMGRVPERLLRRCYQWLKRQSRSCA